MKTDKTLAGMLRICLLTATLTFGSCSNDSPQLPSMLSFSVGDTIRTDKTSCEFDIVSGNGGYQAYVECTNGYTQGSADITGNHVKVELIDPVTYLTITDKNGYSQKFFIESSDSSLIPVYHSIYLNYGCPMESSFNQGVGGYSIIRQTGSHATELTLGAGYGYVLTPLAPDGRDWYILKDRRGSIFYVEAVTARGCDIRSEATSFQAGKNEMVYFPLKYGEGNWKIISRPDNNSPFILVISKAGKQEYDVLQVQMWDKDEPMTFVLEDRNGLRTELNVYPKK
ncbi:hypothetical protein [Bacteroides ilei]|jgi:hypothetical protein|uniref:hypothetical protein n=1 Tax=Bacteroides ilei TaxID=1907658 RepID=UPI000930939F|nr:hypothetical protein [Bacteroides ilei]